MQAENQPQTGPSVEDIGPVPILDPLQSGGRKQLHWAQKKNI
jgi:hypothetical protein